MTSKSETDFARQCVAIGKNLANIVKEYSDLQRSAKDKLAQDHKRMTAQDAKIAKLTHQLDLLQAALEEERALRQAAENRIAAEAQSRAALHGQLMDMATRLEDSFEPAPEEHSDASLCEEPIKCRKIRGAETLSRPEQEISPQPVAGARASSAVPVGTILLPDDLVLACERAVTLGIAPDVPTAAESFMRAGLQMASVVSPVRRKAGRDRPPP